MGLVTLQSLPTEEKLELALFRLIDIDGMPRRVDQGDMEVFLRVVAPAVLSDNEIQSLVTHVITEARRMGMTQPQNAGRVTHRELMAWQGSRAIIDWMDAFRSSIMALKPAPSQQRSLRSLEKSAAGQIQAAGLRDWKMSPVDRHSPLQTDPQRNAILNQHAPGDRAATSSPRGGSGGGSMVSQRRGMRAKNPSRPVESPPHRAGPSITALPPSPEVKAGMGHKETLEVLSHVNAKCDASTSSAQATPTPTAP